MNYPLPPHGIAAEVSVRCQSTLSVSNGLKAALRRAGRLALSKPALSLWERCPASAIRCER